MSSDFRSAVQFRILAWGAAAILPVLVSAHPVAAQPARMALVIANATYTATSLPAVPACTAAARAVAEKLRAAEYDVIERTDVTTGGFDGAVGDFSNRLTAAPGATAFIYVCSRGASLNDRAFVLPVSATLERPTDLFTQGVLAKSLYDVVQRGRADTAVVALDIVPPATGPRPTGFDAIADGVTLDGLAAITVIEPATGTVATRLSEALVTALGRPTLANGALVMAIQEQLGTGSATVVARQPKTAGLVVGRPPAPPPAPPPPVATAPPPPPPPVTTAPPAPTTTTAAVPPPAMPEEHLMTLDDRRRIQEALRNLGYYAITVDGIFGPETRAAIRKYQMQLMAQPTGRLTAEQAGLLVSGR